MSPRSVVLLVVAAGCGLFASFSVVRYVKSSGQKAPVQGIPVVVAARPLQTGTVIESGMVRVVRLPKEVAPKGAFSSVKDVVGQVLTVPVDVNAPIVHSAVASSDGVIQAMVSPGMRAYTVQLEGEAARLAKHIRSGDRVDVVWIGAQGPEQSMEAKLLMQDVRVLAVGDPGAKAKEGSRKPSYRKGIEREVVTLEVSPAQFLLLASAVENGRIKLALRRPGETGTAELPAVDITKLWEEDEPEQTEEPPANELLTATTDEYVIEIINGDSVERQTYQRMNSVSP